LTDGLLVVDKPTGWTSHDVIARCRKVVGQKRVGHSGTLDPGATGVLLVGLGRATRLLRFLTDLPKSYTGEVVLGVETTTLDADGEPVASHDMAHVTLEEVRAAAVGLTGAILQVPPMVSAVKVGGRRLHELARKGEEVERAPRPVTVHRFAVDAGPAPDVLRIEVDCSSGTYVRVLAADLGRALGGGAHLRNLRRTAIGSFGLTEATPLDQLTVADALPPVTAMRDYPNVTVDATAAADVAHGRPLDIDPPGSGPYAVLDETGALLAVYEGRRPAVVVSAA
jgi:tRNA pseudouridine55 synthase